jgi:hypothetical protein
VRRWRIIFRSKKRWWLRLKEKGGKVNEMGCHHKLEQYLDEYIAAAGIAEDNVTLNDHGSVMITSGNFPLFARSEPTA